MMKTVILLAAIITGVFFPYGHDYVYLIRYFLMMMLFFSFLDVKLEKKIICINHFFILAAILFTSVALYLIIKPFNIILAQAAFIAAIAPTAIGAPVVVSLKKGNVEFTAFSLLLNNVVVAFLIPFLLPLLIHNNAEVSIGKILAPILITILVPFAAAQIIKIMLPKIWSTLVGWKDSSFFFLMGTVYIAISDASYYIHTELTANYGIVLLIAITSVLLCIFYFLLGWIIGGKKFAFEASQSLGQKNNAFTIWVSLSFISPAATLGPVFYVLAQNVYISWELYNTNSVHVSPE
jgi:bile acid:Na+ symporter, BASS family